jgi:rubrerythrin
MDEQTIAKRLIDLAQLDIDAVHAYTRAIDQIDLPEVRDQLVAFCADHIRHVDDLSTLIISMDAEPPEYQQDFKGDVIERATALGDAIGTVDALNAMRKNETLTSSRYEAILKKDLPEHVRDVVRKNSEDERRQLHYIEQCIENEVWEDRDVDEPVRRRVASDLPRRAI